MVWLPDHIWEAQKKGKGKGGGDGGGGKGWTPVWQPQWGKGFGGSKGKGKGKGKGLKSFKPEQKVWIGSITEGTTWKELQEHMNQAGKTKWVEVFEGKGTGTGAVAYESGDEAMNAIATLNGSILKGGPIECDVWQKPAA